MIRGPKEVRDENFSSQQDLLPLLIQEAKSAGFPLAGAVDLDLALQDPKETFNAHLQRYDQWLLAGFAGKMEYLARGRDRRSDPRLVFPQAQSIFCVALPYSSKAAGASTLAQGPRYARYLQGPDYHLEIAPRLENVMQAAKSKWRPNPSTPELQWKICVDTSAILERTWAALAGLGWIGKNTLLIHPQYGSYLFLAEVLLNQTTGQGPHLLPNYCGNCTRCLSACPTEAFVDPGSLDSKRCVSYWTLEKRGELEISTAQKNKIKNWIAGCDICQEVCPFNRKPTQREEASETNKPSKEQAHQNATLLQHWVDLLAETSEKYRARIKYSALSRVKPAQFSRNLAITLANSLTEKDAETADLVKNLIPLITLRRDQEEDEVARREWQICLDLTETMILSTH